MKYLSILLLILLSSVYAEDLGGSNGAKPNKTNTWTASQTWTVPLVLKEAATPANPAATFFKLYVKNTGILYVLNSAGVETAVGVSPLTTKGDVYTYSTANARLGVGVDGTVLTADSAEATGLRWVSPTAAGAAGGALSGSYPNPAVVNLRLDAATPFNTVVGSTNAQTVGTATHITTAGYRAGHALTTTSYYNTIFGANAGLLTTGQNNAYFGNGAGETIVTGVDNTFVGNGTGTGIGTSVSRTILIGSNTGQGLTNAADSNIIIGNSATGGTGDYNIIMGRNTSGTGISNTFTAGHTDYPINSIYFGGGTSDTDGTPTHFTIYGTPSASGFSDTAGGNVNIEAGFGVGAGLGGQIALRTAPVLGSGGTAQTAVDRLSVLRDGAIKFTGFATDPAVSAAGSGTIYFDTDLNKFRVSQNNGAYADLVGAGGGALASDSDQNTAGGTNSTDSITGTSGLRNSGFGYDSLTAVTTGDDNVGIGHGAGDAITTGLQNTAVGKDALGGANVSNTVAVGFESLSSASLSGIQNTAVGFQSGKAITTAQNNTLFGYLSGTALTTASAVGNNTFIGNITGQSLTTGYQNTAIGSFAMSGAGVTGAYNNVAAGYAALQNVTGNSNTALGVQAGDGITSGVRNVAVGINALGSASGNAVSDVTAIGNDAGLVNTADWNTFIGSNAGEANTSGLGQVFVGYNAGLLATGANNTIVGYRAGDGLTTGTNNVFMGSDAAGSASGTAVSHSVIIGFNAGLGNQSSNQVIIGAYAGPQSTHNTSSGTCVLIGASAGGALIAGSDSNVFVGYGAGGSVTTGEQLCLLGNSAAPSAVGATKEFVAGSVSFEMSKIYFGKGVTNTSATDYRINGTGGSGSDNAGAAVILSGGKGTGTAKGGDVVIETSPSIGTGSTAQTLYNRYVAQADGIALTDAVATTVATWTLATGTTGGGRIVATIRVTDGTDFQSMTQYVEVALVNKAGTYTTDIVSTTGAKAVSDGTLTTTWTVTAAGAVQLAADTSLTPSGTNGFVVYYTVENNSQSNVTLP